MFGASVAVIGFFLQALLNPVANVSWIYSGALAIFFIEFLSIHSSGMLSGYHQEKKRAFEHGRPIKEVLKDNPHFLIIFYGIFTVAISLFLKVWFLPLYFLASTYIKIHAVSRKDIPPEQENKNMLILSVLIFLGTTFFVAYTIPVWTNIFPFPDSVLAAKPSNASGVFVDTPQTLLVWGVLYFSIHFLINIYILIKPKKLN